MRLPEQGGPAAYADGIAAVIIVTVVTVDDVLFSFDEGKSATAAGWWRGDVHVLMDSALPHFADFEANCGAVLRGDSRRIRVKGVLDRDDSPCEDRRKLFQFFGRRPGYCALTRVNLLGCSKEPDDPHQERQAHQAYGCERGHQPLTLCDHCRTPFRYFLRDPCSMPLSIRRSGNVNGSNS